MSEKGIPDEVLWKVPLYVTGRERKPPMKTVKWSEMLKKKKKLNIINVLLILDQLTVSTSCDLGNKI